MNIAILHPQCRVRGGAIKMALLTAQSLKKQGHQVVFYTFEHDSECFPELQEGLTIVTEKTRKGEIVEKIGNEQNQSGSHRQEFVGSDNQGHTVNSAKSHSKFDIVDTKPSFWNIFRRLFPGIFPIISIAWDIRQVDIVITNDPPMQIVAAFAKFFSLFSEYHQRLVIIWWHHHIPGYYVPKQKESKQKPKIGIKTLKGWFERHWIIPQIKYMVATSYYAAFCIEKYCGRKSTVIHPVINTTNQIQQTKYKIQNEGIRPVVLFSHGRLEPGKGFDTLVKVWRELNKNKEIEQKQEIDKGMVGSGNPPLKPLSPKPLIPSHEIKLVIAGDGSLKNELESQGAIVIPYHDGLLEDLQKTENDILAVYLSTIDAFGMAPLEAQLAGLSTMILDRGGARETVLLDNNKQPIAQLIDNENEILTAITYFIQQRQLHKRVSNVNFCHHTEYFSLSRLDADIRSLIDSVR